MVLKLPLTSAALTKGRQRYKRSFCVWPLVATPPPWRGKAELELAFGSPGLYWPGGLEVPGRAGDLFPDRLPPMLARGDSRLAWEMGVESKGRRGRTPSRRGSPTSELLRGERAGSRCR